MDTALLYPVYAHLFLLVLLYAGLTLVRAPAVWGLGARYQQTLERLEPRISANLRNQFEWPLLFYAACLWLVARGESMPPLQCWLAWLFVLGRWVHSTVQILTTNVRLRGIVFTINFLAVLLMWIAMPVT